MTAVTDKNQRKSFYRYDSGRQISARFLFRKFHNISRFCEQKDKHSIWFVRLMNSGIELSWKYARLKSWNLRTARYLLRIHLSSDYSAVQKCGISAEYRLSMHFRWQYMKYNFIISSGKNNEYPLFLDFSDFENINYNNKLMFLISNAFANSINPKNCYSVVC